MRLSTMSTLLLLALLTCGFAPAALANDVDGGNDCANPSSDFGDAPEGIQAYPGVLAAFPTCLTPGPVGTQTGPCPPISLPPGAAGFVRHVAVAGEDRYWLGCGPGQSGVDHEPDGKVNDSGAVLSTCSSLNVDCFEIAFGLTFGQDECYGAIGSDDAGIDAPVSFAACQTTMVDVNAWLCGTNDVGRTVIVNVLVDWNQDGDWNDSFDCAGACVYEWAVKNMQFTLTPGCNTLSLPIAAGPTSGNGWMRVTISNDPVGDDFPWAGSEATPDLALYNGETEDYPITITGGAGGGSCLGFEDFGDAPEGVQAYSNGTPGRFPTCLAPHPAGVQDLACGAISAPPAGDAGFVRHVALPPDPVFWLGCGDPALGTSGVDAEPDGKTNDTGGAASACDPLVPTDCVEGAFGMSFGQDECYAAADRDAGLAAAPSFTACTYETIPIQTYNCDQSKGTPAYLNILIDMNQDGDWDDNFRCPQACAFEWAVKNAPILLPPGCSTQQSPPFLIGPNAGAAWMRVTISLDPVANDFPWNGSAGAPGGILRSGETEDYPVTIDGPDTCAIGYTDFGDAPEGNTAYASGIAGTFPTCIAPGAVATQEIECETPPGTAPAAAGWVEHRALPADPLHFWLGCGTGGSPLMAVDSEADGKTNTLAPFGGPSICDPAQSTDCIEGGLVGIGVNQDECVGDLDAGMRMPTFFRACSTASFDYEAYNCSSQQADVFLNVLVDFNHDGDWNDNLLASCGVDTCANEWAVKNHPLVLGPGCNFLTTPQFSTGPDEGRSWLRLTLTVDPVPDDFPWNGSAGTPAGYFQGGETEDHPVNIVPRTTGVDAPAAGGRLWFGPPRPNPAHDRVTFQFALPAESRVTLGIYDPSGRRLAELAAGTMGAGAHTLSWDFRDGSGTTVAPGVYLAKLESGGESLTRAVIRVR